jgi:DNA-binding LytR/AlgR family response regulator
MTALRVMVLDDEPLAIERLADLLARIDGIEVVGAHRDAADALDRLSEVRPDLIMVDVEMPKVDGFDFVEALAKQGWLDAESAPCICFVTAYPQFATEAFETGALDFLCKPVRLSRLEKTIDRCRLTLAQREALARLHELQGQLDALRESRSPQVAPSLWVHRRGQMMRVPIETLEWIEAEGEYVRLHMRDQSFLFRSSISSLAGKLADFGFARIHRSTLINESRIAAVHSNRSGMKAELDSGITLAVGRKYRPAVRALQRAEAAPEPFIKFG